MMVKFTLKLTGNIIQYDFVPDLVDSNLETAVGVLIYCEYTDECQSGSSVRERSDCVTEAASHSSAGVGLFWNLDFREMMLIFGVMLLLQTAACLDRFCRFNQSDPCYAALGHKLNVLMMQNAINYDMRVKKRINYNKTTDPVCRVKNGRMRDCDLYSNRTEVAVINGTLIINRVIRADSGNYTLSLYHCSNCSETSIDLQVNVEAPIGSVEVSISCSSSGVMRVFCSSEGDQILYSWTLNGDPLMDGNSSIDLDEGTDGSISCSVKNHVSHRQKTVSVKPCHVSVSVFALVWCFQLMVLLGLLGGFHIYMRHTSGKHQED